MNKNEQILVDTVGGINRLYGGATLRSGQRLLGLCMDMAPKLVGQREYKMFSNLVKCGGNEALLDAIKDTPAAQEQTVARLTRRMADEYVMDETAARRICALYMTAVSGSSAYIDRMDAAEEAKKQPAQKQPAQRQASASVQKPAARFTFARKKPARDAAPAAERETKAQPRRAAAVSRPSTPAGRTASAPAETKAPSVTKKLSSVFGYKNSLLRFIPMAILALGGIFIWGRRGASGFNLAGHPAFFIVYFIAAVYCYIIAFPFKDEFENNEGFGPALRNVVAVLFCFVGDLMLFFMAIFFGDACFSGTFANVIDVDLGIKLLEYILGVPLGFVFGTGMWWMPITVHYFPWRWTMKWDWGFNSENMTAAALLSLLSVVMMLTVGGM